MEVLTAVAAALLQTFLFGCAIVLMLAVAAFIGFARFYINTSLLASEPVSVPPSVPDLESYT